MMVNRRIFRLRNNAPRVARLGIFVFAGILAAVILFVLIGRSNEGFLAYHSKKEYKPLSGDDSIGFYGKVNHYLQQALSDTDATVPYSFRNINNFYKRLDFYFPSDTLQYLARTNELRLIAYRPDAANAEDVRFYYNSDFKRIIDRQQAAFNLSEQYFVITFDRSSREPRIKSIRVDTMQFRMPLTYNYWKGRIEINDPYREINPDILYLSGDGATVPLFANTRIPVEQFQNGACQWAHINFPFRAGSVNYKYLYNAVGRADSAISIRYDNNQNSIRFLNHGENLYIQNHNQQHINLVINERDTIRTGQTRTVPVAQARNGIRLSVVKENGLFALFHISDLSPYYNSSLPVNGSITGHRFEIDSQNVDISLFQQLRVLRGAMDGNDTLNMISLSGNPALSQYLEQEIRRYTHQLKNNRSIVYDTSDIIEMSMTLMDAATGEVLATPFYGNYFSLDNTNDVIGRKNFNLELHDIGSTFKPLLFMAGAIKFPSLSGFALTSNTTFSNEDETRIVGYRASKFGWRWSRGRPTTQIPLFWQHMPIQRREALSISHDTYPIAITLLSLMESNDEAYPYLSGARAFDNARLNALLATNNNASTSRITLENGRTLLKDLPQSSLFKLLQYLYDVQVSKDGSETNYDTRVLRSLPGRKVGFLSPEKTSFFDTTFLGAAGYDLMSLKADILGQGNNRWSNIKLAEAYARSLTGKRTEASFLKMPADVQYRSLFSPAISGIYAGEFTDSTVMAGAWNAFKADWLQAVANPNSELLSAALRHFRAAYTQMNADPGPDLPELQFYCKTGTPQEVPVRLYTYQNQTIYVDEGLFAFGIVTSGENVRGVTGVIHIRHLSRRPIAGEGERAIGVESVTAREFLNSNRFRELLFYCKNRFR